MAYWLTPNETPGETKSYDRSLCMYTLRCASRSQSCEKPTFRLCDPVTYEMDARLVKFGWVSSPYRHGVASQATWVLWTKKNGLNVRTPTSSGRTVGCSLGEARVFSIDAPAWNSSRLVTGMVQDACVRFTGSKV